MYKRKRASTLSRDAAKKRLAVTKDTKPARDRTVDLSEEFLARCEEDFKADPVNVVARNAVASVGVQFSTTNSNRVNELNYIFMNSVKKYHLKATDQGHSGRCWMFAALNTFRHIMIKALELENFEFSQTYLFFWDKFERCNSYIRWFIDHPEQTPNDRAYEYMLMDYMGDGGWWNTFANLVNKYGMIPKDAMRETATSGYSDEMNQILKERIDSCVNFIGKNRHKMNEEELLRVKDDTMKKIYCSLVKFLGEPPKKFNWSFKNDEDQGSVVSEVTPHQFKEMVIPGIDLINDFVTLCHVPTEKFKMNTKYRVKYTNNVYEGARCEIYNVPIEELSKYAMKSISGGFAVWFAGDVSQAFNWYHSALDDKLDDHKIVFGETHEFTKGDRITHRSVAANHAMALTGFNMDEKGRPLEWQVENSWGYWDHETPGLDGFLTMSQSWFEKYLIEIVVHKNFLSRTMKKKVESAQVVEVEPWDSMAPAIRVGVVRPPHNYRNLHPRK